MIISPPGAQILTLVTLISYGPICYAILAGNSSSPENVKQHQQDTISEKYQELNVSSSNVTVGDDELQLASVELDTNSTFYYDANAFLLNKRKDGQADPRQRLVQRGRGGRMLDLDALVGDLAASKANRESRAQLTSRQSRQLADTSPRAAGGHQLDIGGGKRLHIQGFIPIVGVKDDSDEDDSAQVPHVTQQISSSTSKQRPKMMSMSSGQMQPTFLPQNSFELPGYAGQSSLGHATFNVQRYLNTDPSTGESNNNQFVPLPPPPPQMSHSHQQQQQQQLVEAKFSNFNVPQASGASGLVNSLKKPIRKLTNSFGGVAGGVANNDLLNGKQLLTQTNCLCVPFYMCKGGHLSESGLGRAQIQQMIANQQQQFVSTTTTTTTATGQQPRQVMAEQVAPDGGGGGGGGGGVAQMGLNKPGTVESVISTGQEDTASVSYANSMVPVDERSFERDLITAAPDISMIDSNTGDSARNQTNGEVTQQQAANLSTVQTGEPNMISPPQGSQAANSSSELANPDDMTTLNQANDYTQDILGRMLGLKSAATSQQLQPSERQQSSGGVCGLLRTCCAIPSHLLSHGQQQQQQQQQVLKQQLIQQQEQLMQQQHQQQLQVALQRYHQPQQISRMQTPATSGVSAALQQLAALPSSLIHRTSNLPPPRPVYSPAQQMSLQQYSRASHQQQHQQQPLTSNQQQQQQPVVQPPVIGGPTLQVARSQVASPGGQHQQLGTRKLLEGRCGLRHSTGINGRVQNLAYHENAAEFGEYPAQAAILKRLNGSESLFVCGGTLISQSWVATAAHCIRKHMQGGGGGGGGGAGVAGQLKVRLGEWDVHRDDEFYPYVEKEIRDLVVHPEFVPGNLINDLALVRLDSPVDSSLPHVNPACLPTLDETFARQRCWVTGWGKDSFGTKGSFQSVLQEVELPVQGHAECELQLRQTRLGPHYRLHPGFICAGGEGGRDACEGDGGSGLYCAQEGVIKVAGLVSWGIGCGQAGVPGVYVNVAHYRPWIENIIAIDEDIYSSYSQLPNTLISERSPDASFSVVNSTSAPDG